MNKKRVEIYLLVILLIGIILVLSSYVDFKLTTLVTYEQSENSNFEEGNYENTEYNGSEIILVGENLSGIYTSKIFDANSSAQWNIFSWEEILPNVLNTLFISPVYSEDSWGQDISSKVNAREGTDTWERVEVQTWNETMSEGTINSVIGYCSLKWIDSGAQIGFQISRDNGDTWDSEICLQDVIAHTTFSCDLKTNSDVDTIDEINNLRMRCTFPTAGQGKYYSTDFVYVEINYTSSPTDLTFQVRSCDNENCNNESWNNISGISPQDLFLDNNRYFQYKTLFETSDNSYSPSLQDISIDYSILNSAPIWELITNQTWDEDTTLIINLTNYSSDSDGNNLNWSFEEVANITITIEDGIATLVPTSNWFGIRNIIFIVTDGIESVNSNNINLIVNDVAEPSVSSGSSGGGSGGGGGSSSRKRVSVVTSSEINKGTVKELRKNEKIEFEIKSLENSEKHSISLNSVSNDEIEITIQSDPITLAMKIGESKKFDLTGDGFYDLYVELENIINNNAKIKIQEINEEISFVENIEESSEIVGAESQNALSDEIIEDKDADEVRRSLGITGAITGFSKTEFLGSLISITLIIVILTYLIIKKLKRKRNNSKPKAI